MPFSNICPIVDALDECEINLKGLTRTLETGELRLYATSRPEVMFELQKTEIDSIDPESYIALFIGDQLNVEPAVVQALAAKTTPSVIVASTICKYINEGDAEEKIERLLQTQAIADLELLYVGILDDISRKLSVQGRKESIMDLSSAWESSLCFTLEGINDIEEELSYSSLLLLDLCGNIMA